MSLVTIKRISPSPNKKGKLGSRIVPYKSIGINNGSPRSIRCIFENLPVEIVVRIVSYLVDADVCRLSRTNRFFSSFCKSDIVWRGLFKQRWGPKVPTTTLELPEVQKKVKEHTSNMLATKASPNTKKKVMAKPSWKEAYKARVFKTCSMCNAVAEGNDSLAAWMGFRFCKKCQRERFITKKLGLAMFDIKPKDFEQLRYFEIMLGASGRLHHPVRLYYIDDIQGIVEAREEDQKLKHKKKKQKKGSCIDDSVPPQQATTNGGISAIELKKLSQEEEKTKRLEEKLIKNQVRPFI